MKDVNKGMKRRGRKMEKEVKKEWMEERDRVNPGHTTGDLMSCFQLCDASISGSPCICPSLVAVGYSLIYPPAPSN